MSMERGFEGDGLRTSVMPTARRPSVSYRPLVQREMREQYVLNDESTVDGRVADSKLRRFTVTTDEKVKT